MRKLLSILTVLFLVAGPATADPPAGSITHEFQLPPRGARTLLINNPGGPLDLLLMVTGVPDSSVLFSTDGENTEHMQTGTAYRIRLPERQSLYLHNGSEADSIRGIYRLIVLR